MPRGVARPAALQVSVNARRDSARSTASTLAPIRVVPACSSTPLAASSTARLRAVWPPRVGSRASGRSARTTAATRSAVSGSR